MGYYNSFVIRIWTDDHGRIRGRIEHVASHESQGFLDPAAIVEFIHAHLLPPASVANDPAEEQITED